MAEKLSIRKTRRLRTLLAKLYKLPEPPDHRETCLERIVMTVLWQDVRPADARAAFAKLAEEFIDWNELRVTVTSEVSGILDGCGVPGRKGAFLKRILGRAVERLYSLDFEQLGELPREKLATWFTSIVGLPHHVAAYVLYNVYDHDRVLVGEDIARVLRRLGLVAENATPREIEPPLNAVIPAKEAYLVYNGLRQHAVAVCTEKDFDCRKCPLFKECASGKGFVAEMEAAAKAARQAARREARAKAKAAREAAKKKAKAAREKAKAAKSKAKSKAKTAKTKAAARAKKKPTRTTKAKPRKRASSRAKAKKKARR